MHELSLCEGILQILRSEGQARAFRRVRVVRLELGPYCCASPEALEFCFQVASRQTIADGALLDIVRLPAEAWCMDCAQAVSIADRGGACPRCGGVALQTRGGDDMRIRELEVE
jgi:hydrogenase nickel incorporation protein HypA/HybF